MFPISSSLGFQPLQYALTEFKDKFLQILGSVNVYQESVIVVFYFRLVETVFYQSCLSQPPGEMRATLFPLVICFVRKRVSSIRSQKYFSER